MDRDPGGAQGSGIAHRIHVADHGRQPEARGQRYVGAAVRGHDLGREGERRRERARWHRAAADQGYWAGSAVEGVEVCQSRITTAETLFFGEPSMSLSE